jgi:hypothetical protein
VLGGVLACGAILFVTAGGPVLVAPRDGNAVWWLGLTAIGAFVAGVIALAIGARQGAVRFLLGLAGGVAVVVLLVLVMCMAIAANINAQIPPPGSAAPSGSAIGSGNWLASVCQCGVK